MFKHHFELKAKQARKYAKAAELVIFHNVKECFAILVKMSKCEKVQIENSKETNKACIDKLKEKGLDAIQDKLSDFAQHLTERNCQNATFC